MPTFPLITIDGVVVDLSQFATRERRLVSMLASRVGEVVTKEHLAQTVCPTAGGFSVRQVDSAAVMARRVLAPLGLELVNVWGVGYTLESTRTIASRRAERAALEMAA